MTRADTNTKLRTTDCWDRYQNKEKSDGCFMCNREKLVQFYEYWYICENDYPYDAVAEVHHMLVPYRHVSSEDELSRLEKRELELILNWINNDGTFDCYVKNFTVAQSEPGHLHYHLLRWKRV